jgi:hypothetical protein
MKHPAVRQFLTANTRKGSLPTGLSVLAGNRKIKENSHQHVVHDLLLQVVHELPNVQDSFNCLDIRTHDLFSHS